MDSEHAAMKFTVLSSIMYLVSCDAMPCGCLEDAWYTFGKPELKRWVELHMEPYHLVTGLRQSPHKSHDHSNEDENGTGK
jgi:hypothetical protein